MKIIILIMLLPMVGFSQTNLVPNPSFEQYDTCPDIAGRINYAIPWTNPLHTSPDYFNVCSISVLGVPNNYAGFEYARTGVAYAGIAVDRYDPNNAYINDYREYVQIKLLEQLNEGETYCIEFYVSACDSSNFVSNDIGVYFSPRKFHDTTHPYLINLPFTPQIVNSANLSSRIGWTKVSGKFIADGGEEYMIIGNFKNHISTISTPTGWTNNVNIHNFAAYYIDDVAVFNCDSDNAIITMPNVFTPNGDLLNDLFVPLTKKKNLFANLEIYNRWGVKIFETDKIYEGWDGGDFPDGVYYWLLNYIDMRQENHRSNGLVVLIR